MNWSDKVLAKGVYTSLQVYYHNRGIVDVYQKMVESAKETVLADMLSRIEKNGFKVIFSLKNFKTNKTEGKCYVWNGKSIVVELNAKALGNVNKMAEVLGHELVHVEQFMSKKLTCKKNAWYWNGKPASNKGTTYAAYRAQPWEVEAFARQDENKGKILSAYFKKA